MSLATRCTACGTVFRVVQDQLKISEGWVRCGRCKEVFNALEGLFDLDREAPPQWEPPPPVPKPGMTTVDVQLPDDDDAVAAAPLPPPAPEPAPIQQPVARLHAPAPPAVAAKAHAWPAPAPAPAAPSPPAAPAPIASAPVSAAPAPRAAQMPEFDDARFAASQMPNPSLPNTSMPSAIWQPSADEEEPAVAPNFLREAERRARWQSPRARVALGVAAVLLMVVLALQGAYHWRDIIAARWPDTQPLLVETCTWLDCTVGPLRRIEEIAVESTALTHAGPGAPPDALRLSVALRSRSAVPLAMPTIDLSLTDVNGELVARRALSAGDFRSPTTSLAPGAESNLQLVLTVEGRRVAGYTVEIFYP